MRLLSLVGGRVLLQGPELVHLQVVALVALVHLQAEVTMHIAHLQLVPFMELQILEFSSQELQQHQLELQVRQGRLTMAHVLQEAQRLLQEQKAHVIRQLLTERSLLLTAMSETQ